MRNLWPLILVAALIYFGNRSCGPQLRQAFSPATGVADSHSGGTVREMERAPDALIDMGNAMPQGGGGSSSKAMRDAARSAGK